jgi:MFS family permease
MNAASRRTGLTAALRGPFGLLWAGQSVSLLGDGVFLVAFAWQLAVQWRQPALLGLLLSVRVLAELATLALGGWIVDRLPRRTTVLAADVGRALLLLGLAAALHRPPPMPTLVLLLVGYGVLTALFRPALVAYIPQVVHRDRLAAANALLALSLQASMVAGPAIGASLVSLGSAPTALRLNSLSFLFAAATTLPLPSRPAAAGTASPLAQAVEGFRTARRVGWIGGTILLISLGNLGTITAQRLALPAAAHRYGQLGGYGATLAAIGAGAMVAAVAVGRSRPPREPGRTAYAGVLLFGLATTAFGLVHGIVAAVVVGLAFGFGLQLAELLWTIGLQRFAPERLLGRISAVEQFGSFVFLPVSFAFGGLLVQAASPELVLLGAGAVGMLTAAIGLTVPGLYRWRPLSDDVAAARQAPVSIAPWGSDQMPTSPATDDPPATPRLPVASPPPCWCGRTSSDHTAGHDYAPAAGVESEAHDAW